MALLAVTLAGCSGAGTPAEGLGAVPASVDVACPVPAGEQPAKAVLRCAEPSVAFVETMYASGTGIVVGAGGQRYVVTNLHVVEPFDHAEVSVDGVELGSVPFLGADVAADIALLGPIEAEVTPLPVADGVDLERGDAVFLIGHPGDSTSEGNEVTIASGIVSRHRGVPEWDQLYVQSDATISGGQSGGPLFDDRGRLVGISGLAFEDFALSLSGRDVVRAIDGILGSGGDDVLTVPAAVAPGGARSGSIEVDNAGDVQGLYLPPSDQDRTWTLEVAGAEADVSVSVIDTSTGDLLAVNAGAEALQGALRQLLVSAGVPAAELDQALPAERVPAAVAARETGPGTFTIAVEAGVGADVVVHVPLADGPRSIPWRSDQPLWPSSRPVTSRPLALGETADAVLNALDTSVDFLVDLPAGETVEVWARSPQGDVGVAVVPPGVRLDPVAAFDPTLVDLPLFDDSDEGLYGLDVREPFTATEGGTYRFKVYSMELVPTAVRFEVSGQPGR